MCTDCNTTQTLKKFVINVGAHTYMVSATTAEEAVRSFSLSNRMLCGSKVSIMEWSSPTVFLVDITKALAPVDPTATK